MFHQGVCVGKSAKSTKNHAARFPYKEINLPVTLSIFDEKFRDNLLNAITRIHKVIKRGNRRIRLNFSATAKIHSSAMLLLFAEICNILNIYPDIKISCKQPRNAKASHVLNQIGLYKLLKINFNAKLDFNDVIYWRSCFGNGVMSKNFDTLVNKNECEILKKEIDLYGGCIEATKNVRRHAYIKERDLSPVAKEKTEWWAFSQVKDGYITINICDLGISIPVTLPITRKNLFEHITKNLITNSDAELIKGAIEDPTSRTRHHYRGNGLPKIAQVAKELDHAVLEIHSRNGYVRICKDAKRRLSFGYSTPIPGTIISWQLPLGDINNEKNYFNS